MYDFHLHSRVSFDGHDTGLAMALAAKEHGMEEICFTDHRDYGPLLNMVFDPKKYHAEYDHLEVPGLTIRKGMEFGLTPDNMDKLHRDLQGEHYDFVLGSVHFVDGQDVYLKPYFLGKTVFEATRRHLEETLRCVQAHQEYDVLAHLTYIGKSRGNPTHEPVRYEDHRELIDAILAEVARHDKGLEVNTSGIDRCGGSLPTMDMVRRFRELGGKIVTIGSDAHDTDRAGQYCWEMAEQVKKVFGYVCTFENRQPVFHK